MSYKAGIVKAIEELKDRSGSSQIAIKKHMQANMPTDKKWMNSTFLKALKDAVTKGELVQVKNSYKLSADFKKKTSAVATKPKAPKKVVTPKKTAPKKKSAPKKKAAPKKLATTTKKTTEKKVKSATKKSAAKKPTEKKAKTATKKVTTKKSTEKKAVKKTPAKKSSAKKTSKKAEAAVTPIPVEAAAPVADQ